jgi:hypothetical protein
MKASKKQPEQNLFKPITLDEAVKLSEGYFTCVESIRNAICRGKLHRYGPPKRTELNYYEFMQYMGRPA